MKILVVHEVNYLTKIIYEYQILPEILSMLGHEVTVVDYDETWESANGRPLVDLKTRIHANIHRAYSAAAVTLRRPGMIRIPLLSRISGAIMGSLEVERALASGRFDVVLLYAVPTLGLQTILAAHQHNVPIIFRSIDIMHELVPRPLLTITKSLEHFVYNRVNGVVALTPRLKEHIRSYGVPSSRIRLLSCGVDTQMFSPGPRDDDLMASWGIHKNDPVLLFMGTIYRFSGLDRVIRDFSRLRQSYPNTKLLIVGHGEDEQKLKRLAVDCGVSSSVILTGLQPYSSLPNYIRSADICINPFELNAITRDILPNKLFQYLSCGKPLVATPLLGTLPFLRGESDGVVYTDLDNFVPQIALLLNDSERRAAVGKAGHAATQQRFDWRKIAEQMIVCIQELS